MPTKRKGNVAKQRYWPVNKQSASFSGTSTGVSEDVSISKSSSGLSSEQLATVLGGYVQRESERKFKQWLGDASVLTRLSQKRIHSSRQPSESSREPS